MALMFSQRLRQQRKKSYQPSRNGVSKLTVEVWEGGPDRPVDHPDNVKLTELVLTYSPALCCRSGSTPPLIPVSPVVRGVACQPVRTAL